MLLSLVRFLSLLLVALTLGLAFAHVAEIPGKLQLAGPDWLTVQHHLYVGFGTIGAVIEVCAILFTWAAAFLVRHRRRAFGWTLAAALLVTVGIVEWALVVSPMNTVLNGWTAVSLPADWTAVRNRWELGHALHALLFAAAFCFLVIGLLVESEAGAVTRRGAR